MSGRPGGRPRQRCNPPGNGAIASSLPVAGCPLPDRLQREPTRMLVAADQSSGTITAQRYVNGRWQSGTITLAVDNGELDASADAAGALAVARLSVNLESIDLPDSVLGKPAQL